MNVMCLWHAKGVMCTYRMGETHSTARTRGSRRPASCGSFVDVFFVARKQAPLLFPIVSEKKKTVEILCQRDTVTCLNRNS